MAVKIAINGFGRIGRLVFRAALENKDVEVVGINDLADNKSLAHLLKYDTTHGTLSNEVGHDDKGIVVDGKTIPVFSERDPAALPWDPDGRDDGDRVHGLPSRSAEQPPNNLGGSVKKVIISAPSGDADAMLVMGVNCDSYDASKHDVVSNASCTTNLPGADGQGAQRQLGPQARPDDDDPRLYE